MDALLTTGGPIALVTLSLMAIVLGVELLNMRYRRRQPGRRG